MALILASGLPMMSGIGHAVDAGTRSAPVVPVAAAGAERPALPQWVIDPAVPGEDLPPRGRSLFDFLVTQERGGRLVEVVPFPFAALLREVEMRMRSQPGATAAKAVLIPLGRSLQRDSAAPEFFAYPRVVVAADGEPAAAGSIYLKDRLYLGYQEKSNLLEVISYNEDAGRFEFQLVTDYRAGGTARVAYANRALCVACHQNAAPIFSRPVWDETNANPRVAALLAAQRRSFHGIPVDRGVDVPNAIDDAALRANRFAVHQLLWSEGCGGRDEAALRCRAGLFAALLQYRLSGQQHFDRSDTSYRDGVAARLAETGRRRWPGGLAIGNPDLPNRNPLPADAPLSPATAIRDSASLVQVAAAFDPLQPRPPLEVRRVAGQEDAAGLVTGLAEFIAEADVLRLDRLLIKRAASDGAARRTHRGACRVQRALAAGGGQRIEFRCASAQDPTGPGLALDGRLILSGSTLSGGSIDRLEIDGQLPLRDIDLAAQRLEARGGQRVAVLAPTRGGMHARGADGNALERIELRWGDRGAAASVVAIDDFAPARRAIEALVRDNLVGSFDGFDPAAFRRARLMPALLKGIGATPDAWCCLDAAGMPPARPARAEVSVVSGAEASVISGAASHAGFYRFCGECHLGAERAPPNFLLGGAEAVEAKLGHCAPRIFVRLSMWRREPAARPKSPMPPQVALHRFGVSASAWRDGDALSALLRSVGARLRAEAGNQAAVDALLDERYENLRACLPEESLEALPQAPATPKRSRHAANLDR